MRRWVRIALLCLIVGCIANIIVALRFAIAAEEGLTTVGGGGSEPPMFALHGEQGWIVTDEVWFGVTYLSALPISGPVTISPAYRRAAPYWSWTSRRLPVERHAFLRETAYGVPFRALRIMHLESGTGEDLLIGIPMDDGSLLGSPRYWPTSVIWPGFIANTLLFAAVLLLPATLFAMMRHAWRRLKGRCTNCGYDLRGAPSDSEQCPECGRAIVHANDAEATTGADDARSADV